MVLLVAIALCAQGRAPELPDLTLRLESGGSWTYTVKQTFREPGEIEPTEELTYRIDARVQGVEKDEYRIEEQGRLVEHKIGGETMPLVQGGPPIVWRSVVSRAGERADVKRPTEDPIEFRLDRLLWLVAPTPETRFVDGTSVSWSRKLPASEGGAVPEAMATWTFVRTGNVGPRKAAWVKSVLEEKRTAKPIVAMGTAVVDLDTGLPLALSVKAIGAQMPGGSGEVYELSLELKNLEIRSPSKARAP